MNGFQNFDEQIQQGKNTIWQRGFSPTESIRLLGKNPGSPGSWFSVLSVTVPYWLIVQKTIKNQR